MNTMHREKSFVLNVIEDFDQDGVEDDLDDATMDSPIAKKLPKEPIRLMTCRGPMSLPPRSRFATFNFLRTFRRVPSWGNSMRLTRMPIPPFCSP